MDRDPSPVPLVSALFATAAPPLAFAEIAEVLASAYGIAGRLSPLGGERDQNVLVEVGEPRRFVLKLCHPAEDVRAPDLEARALIHLANVAPDLPVPRILPTREGFPTVGVATADGGTRHGRLVTYLDGVALAAAPRQRPQAAVLGRLAARLDQALVDFRHEAAERSLLWDVRRAGETRSLLPAISEADARHLAEAALDRFEARADALAELPRQIVHGDLNPHNILVDPADPLRIAGLIDFGDMVMSYRAADPAIAASYCGGSGGGLDGMLDLIRAYHAANPLTETELMALPDLIAARLATSLAIGAWRAARHPENRAYILRNRATALAGLEVLSQSGTSVRESFARALRPIEEPRP
jgi:Ser/Thr protein kinase RdoA (MazF antagonist)